MLRTASVFVDTESFVGSQFDFNSGRLKRLLDLAWTQRVRLVLPAVTKTELHKKLREKLDESVAAVQAVRGKAKMLSGSADPVCESLFAPLDREALVAELSGKLEAYLLEANVIVVAAADDALNRVLSAYFASEPPFGGSKKKHEFPDAIAVDTLREWCRSNDTEVYVVSHDGDLASSCSTAGPLLHLPDLKDLFALVEAQDARAAALLDSALPLIRRQAQENFEASGFILADEDGDVQGVSVTDFRILSARVQDVQEARVLFEAEAEVDCEAEVRYDDYSTASYDSEDKVLIPWNDIEATLERTIELTLYGEIVAESADLSVIESVDVGLSTSETYSIVVDEWDPRSH